MPISRVGRHPPREVVRSRGSLSLVLNLFPSDCSHDGEPSLVGVQSVSREVRAYFICTVHQAQKQYTYRCDAR